MLGTPLTPRRKLFCHRKKMLRECQSGVTAIEFALIAPVFVIMMMGIIEFSMIMFTAAVLESATGNTARLGKTGYIPAGMSREEAIIANIENRTTGLLDPDKITITSRVYSTFENIGDPEPFIDGNGNSNYDIGETFDDVNGNGQWDEDMAQAGLGNAGDVVVYTVTYPWPVVTPIISAFTGPTFTISTRTVVKNEPYDVGS